MTFAFKAVYGIVWDADSFGTARIYVAGYAGTLLKKKKNKNKKKQNKKNKNKNQKKTADTSLVKNNNRFITCKIF